jgi:hypothetical protein
MNPGTEGDSVAPVTARPSTPRGDDTGQPPHRWSWHLTQEQKKLMAGSTAGCVLLILLAWTVNAFVRVIPEEPAIGSVAVLSPRAYVRESAKADAPVVAEVRRGDSMHLLKLPESRSAAWLYVQARPGGKTAKPGYIPVADVASWADWSLDAPASAVTMTSMMCASDSAPPAELQSCLSRWRALEPKTAGKPEEDTVRAQIARFEKLLAPPQAVQTVDVAQTTPAAPGAAPAVDPAKQAPLTADQLVARGRRALESGFPERASWYAGEALKLDAKHGGALSLRNDIREYNTVFGKGSQ